MLAVGAMVIGLLLQPIIPLFRQHPQLLWAAVFWSISQGYNMLWYYQGREQIWRMASFDILFKASALATIFLWVKGPGDEAKALALGAAGWFLSAVVTGAIAYREVGFRRPTLALSWNALRMGWSMFLFRAAFTLYTSGNGFILGLFAQPAQVGYYAGAEKISKGLLTPLSPLSQAVFPRVSYLAVHSRDRAARVAKLSMIVMGLGGIVLGAVAFFFAPLIIRIVLGPGISTGRSRSPAARRVGASHGPQSRPGNPMDVAAGSRRRLQPNYPGGRNPEYCSCRHPGPCIRPVRDGLLGAHLRSICNGRYVHRSAPTRT